MNLIRKIARGNVGALEQLYERYKTGVYRLTLSLTGDPYLAEDITQDTFLRIQENASSYRPGGGEAAWVLTIARNLTYDCLRRRRREICSDDAAREYGGLAAGAFSSFAASGGEAAAGNLYFLDLIYGLSLVEKGLVCLRILGGLPWREIGRITCQSGEACRKRYERILKRLREQFTGQ